MFWSYLLMLRAELCHGQVLCCKADPLHCVTRTCNATTMHHSSGQYVYSYIWKSFLVSVFLWLHVDYCPPLILTSDTCHRAPSNHQGVLPNCLWTALIKPGRHESSTFLRLDKHLPIPERSCSSTHSGLCNRCYDVNMTIARIRHVSNCNLQGTQSQYNSCADMQSLWWHVQYSALRPQTLSSHNRTWTNRIWSWS